MKHLDEFVPLVLIDVQEGFNDPFWGKRNNPHFEENVAYLLDHWRKRGRPIIHVQHLSIEQDSPLRPDREGVRFMEFVRPRSHETLITKNVNSAFIGTNLEEHLRKVKAQNLVMVGLTTDHCVSTSTRMARNLGFEVILAQDATATFDRRLPDGSSFEAELVHRVSLASLNGEFAQVMPTKTILAL